MIKEFNDQTLSDWVGDVLQAHIDENPEDPDSYDLLNFDWDTAEWTGMIATTMFVKLSGKHFTPGYVSYVSITYHPASNNWRFDSLTR